METTFLLYEPTNDIQSTVFNISASSYLPPLSTTTSNNLIDIFTQTTSTNNLHSTWTNFTRVLNVERKNDEMEDEEGGMIFKTNGSEAQPLLVTKKTLRKVGINIFFA